MTDTDDEPQHRAYYQHTAADIEVREDLDDDEGVFVVRMPVASSGEVRNPGDDPLSRDELRGMRDQINDRGVGVFLDHGTNTDIGGARYSATGKIGEWQNADLVTADRGDGGEMTLLVADARLMDPDTLPRIPSRGALGALKSQVDRGLGLASSIGWREDGDYRGGVDLMEASIVGIPADPQTTSAAAETMARAALDTRDDVDADALVAEFRAVVMGPDADHDRETTMTDDTDGGEDTTPDETQDSDDWRERMIDMQERQLETLNALADAMRENMDDDEDDEDDDDEDDEDEQSADAPDETQSEGDDADPDDDTERSIDVDGDEVTAADVREMRDALADAEPERPADDDERDADADTDADSEREMDPLAKYGLMGGQ